jgi:hypothetical protein
MESWRRNVLQEQDNPGTVGELLQGLNAYILSNSDQLKRVAQAIANALEGIMDALGDVDEATKNSVEQFASGAIEFLKSVQEKGLKDAIKEKGKDIAMNVLTTVAKNKIIRNFIVQKVGEKAVKFLIDQVFPAAKSLISAAKWILKVFKVSKELQKAYKEGTADVNQVFQNIVKDIATAEDNKDTTAGFLKLFNIDDEYQKMLDDKIEIKFIEKMIASLKGMTPDTSLEQLNFNNQLIDFLKNEFEGRTLTGQR